MVTETQGKDIYIYNEYDIMGRRTKRQTSLGNMIEYEYDELGNTSAITINGEKTTTIERDKTGLPIRETFSGPLTREYTYNKDGRLTKQNIGTISRSIAERVYAYDKTGNLLEKDDSTKGKSFFSYDPMGRISQYINPENKIEEFLRDPAGDLIKQQDTTLASESKPESYTRTSTHKDSTYTFDAVGNLIKRHNRSKEDLTTFTWDECNRLVRADRNGTVTEMLYDAAGRRISKETNGKKTEFFWDGEQFFADRKDGKIREFIYYPGTFEPLAVVDENRKIFYFNNDLVGLPQEVTTDTGEIVWSASYDAHGKVTKIHEDYFENPLRLQGQFYDSELDLCYNRHRYYDPDTGLFISADPLGLVAGINTYSYASNVWSWIDPMGLMTCPGSGMPDGITYDGTIHRAVNPKYADGAWDIHAGNIGASHRYSDVGRGALYSGTSKKSVLGELKHYDVNPDDVTFLSKNVKVDNVLDLTNPKTRKQLGVKLEDITGDSYFTTHALGDFSQSRYSGMLVPSARDAGSSHLVLFP